jgi:hypothetical protein
MADGDSPASASPSAAGPAQCPTKNTAAILDVPDRILRLTALLQLCADEAAVEGTFHERPAVVLGYVSMLDNQPPGKKARLSNTE